MDQIEETKVLESSPNDQVQYWRMKLPLMSRRESLSRLQVADKEDGKFFLVSSCDHPDAPHYEGSVKVFYHERSIMKPNAEDPDILDYEAYMILSLGGFVPARLTNYTVSNETNKMLNSAYNYLLKNKN